MPLTAGMYASAHDQQGELLAEFRSLACTYPVTFSDGESRDSEVSFGYIEDVPGECIQIAVQPTQAILSGWVVPDGWDMRVELCVDGAPTPSQVDVIWRNRNTAPLCVFKIEPKHRVRARGVDSTEQVLTKSSSAVDIWAALRSGSIHLTLCLTELVNEVYTRPGPLVIDRPVQLPPGKDANDYPIGYSEKLLGNGSRILQSVYARKEMLDHTPWVEFSFLYRSREQLEQLGLVPALHEGCI